MTDRIACINPNCRRTAAREKHPGSTWIICGKCYRALPERHRARWRQLNKRWRKSERLMRKRSTGPVVWDRIVDGLERAWDRLNLDIIHYHTASEQPVGLEGFLKENGLAE